MIKLSERQLEKETRIDAEREEIESQGKIVADLGFSKEELAWGIRGIFFDVRERGSSKDEVWERLEVLVREVLRQFEKEK